MFEIRLRQLSLVYLFSNIQNVPVLSFTVFPVLAYPTEVSEEVKLNVYVQFAALFSSALGGKH